MGFEAEVAAWALKHMSRMRNRRWVERRSKSDSHQPSYLARDRTRYRQCTKCGTIVRTVCFAIWLVVANFREQTKVIGANAQVETQTFSRVPNRRQLTLCLSGSRVRLPDAAVGELLLGNFRSVRSRFRGQQFARAEWLVQRPTPWQGVPAMLNLARVDNQTWKQRARFTALTLVTRADAPATC